MSAMPQTTITTSSQAVASTTTAFSNRRMLCLVIGQEHWEDCLRSLPDEFFDLGETAQETIWGRMLRAANRGQSDPAVLVPIGMGELIVIGGA